MTPFLLLAGPWAGRQLILSAWRLSPSTPLWLASEGHAETKLGQRAQVLRISTHPIPRAPSWFRNAVCGALHPQVRVLMKLKFRKSPWNTAPREACHWAKQDRKGISPFPALPRAPGLVVSEHSSCGPALGWHLLGPLVYVDQGLALRATLGTAEFQ